MFRRDQVQDATLGQRVTAAQRLIRWSDRPPEEVFASGFMPRTIPYGHSSKGPARSLLGHVTSGNTSGQTLLPSSLAPPSRIGMPKGRQHSGSRVSRIEIGTTAHPPSLLTPSCVPRLGMQPEPYPPFSIFQTHGHGHYICATPPFPAPPPTTTRRPTPPFLLAATTTVTARVFQGSHPSMGG